MCYKQFSVGGLHELDIRLLLDGGLAVECWAADSGDVVTHMCLQVMHLKHSHHLLQNAEVFRCIFIYVFAV